MFPTQPCIKGIICFVPDAVLGRLHIVVAVSISFLPSDLVCNMAKGCIRLKICTSIATTGCERFIPKDNQIRYI